MVVAVSVCCVAWRLRPDAVHGSTPHPRQRGRDTWDCRFDRSLAGLDIVPAEAEPSEPDTRHPLALRFDHDGARRRLLAAYGRLHQADRAQDRRDCRWSPPQALLGLGIIVGRRSRPPEPYANDLVAAHRRRRAAWDRIDDAA